MTYFKSVYHCYIKHLVLQVFVVGKSKPSESKVRKFESGKDPVPNCECGWIPYLIPHPEWSEWEGCEESCSDIPIEKTRQRTCEKHICPGLLRCCIKPEREYYDQVEFLPCSRIKPCRKYLLERFCFLKMIPLNSCKLMIKLIGQNGRILQHAPKAAERAGKNRYGIVNVELIQ